MKIQNKWGGGEGGRVGGGVGLAGDQGGCERSRFCENQKNFGGGSGWGGGQDGCERRIEVFVKIQKKKKNNLFFFFFGGGVGLWGQGRCEQRSKVFVKIQK